MQLCGYDEMRLSGHMAIRIRHLQSMDMFLNLLRRAALSNFLLGSYYRISVLVPYHTASEAPHPDLNDDFGYR